MVRIHSSASTSYSDRSADSGVIEVDRSEPLFDSLNRVFDSLEVCDVGGERHGL
jgi:hypothetical protein